MAASSATGPLACLPALQRSWTPIRMQPASWITVPVVKIPASSAARAVIGLNVEPVG